MTKHTVSRLEEVTKTVHTAPKRVLYPESTEGPLGCCCLVSQGPENAKNNVKSRHIPTLEEHYIVIPFVVKGIFADIAH